MNPLPAHHIPARADPVRAYPVTAARRDRSMPARRRSVHRGRRHGGNRPGRDRGAERRLEEPEIENSTAIASELGAAQILQQDNPGLFVSVTMPSTPTGANYFGGLLLDEAKSLGFTPDDYTIMPFDGGFSGGSSQVTALQDFHSQLMSTFGWSSAQAYAHEGFSGMDGRTDTGEYFYQSDFATVLSFVQANGLSRYTFWSVNRDRQCNPPDNNGATSSECSSVTQNPWDFTAYTVAFAKNAPVTQPTPPPSSPPPSSRRPPLRRLPRGAVRRRPGCRARPTCPEMRSRTTATSGPRTSGTTTRCPAVPPAPGTMTVLAEAPSAETGRSARGARWLPWQLPDAWKLPLIR